MLSSNPAAIELLRKHSNLINSFELMRNENAESLIKDLKIPICYDSLAANPADWAVDLLLQPGIIANTIFV